ncbi:MAG: DUF1461 domain-containing protein [archaeon]
MQKVATYVLTAIVPLIIILGVFNFLIFLNDSEVIDYVLTGKTIENTSLTEDELTHLEDVKSLVQIEKIILYALLTLAILLFFILKKKVFNPMYYGGIITVGAILILFLLVIFSFDFAFTIFHKTLFRNDLWLLPTGSKLLELFPKEYFVNFAKKLGLYSIIISLLLIIIGRFKR